MTSAAKLLARIARIPPPDGRGPSVLWPQGAARGGIIGSAPQVWLAEQIGKVDVKVAALRVSASSRGQVWEIASQVFVACVGLPKALLEELIRLPRDDPLPVVPLRWREPMDVHHLVDDAHLR